MESSASCVVIREQQFHDWLPPGGGARPCSCCRRTRRHRAGSGQQGKGTGTTTVPSLITEPLLTRLGEAECGDVVSKVLNAIICFLSVGSHDGLPRYFALMFIHFHFIFIYEFQFSLNIFSYDDKFSFIFEVSDMT